MRRHYKTVKLPEEMVEAIEQLLKEHPEHGYVSVAEFVKAPSDITIVNTSLALNQRRTWIFPLVSHRWLQKLINEACSFSE